MRVKLVVILSAFVLALAGTGATVAFAASGGNGNGNGGNSDQAHANRGQTQKAAASSTTDASHDPSNPDGTYQGKSESTPDQDGIGADHGIDNNDKTGPGTDGNNGCGNDPDREDDNNGWCGRKPANEGPPETPGPTVAPTDTPSGGNDTEVLGETFTKPPSVLGRNLARTGAAILSVALAAMAMVLFGFALRVIARQRHAE